MRLFYAIKFSTEAKNSLLHLKEELASTVRSGRETDIENLHLTLHFVGDAETNEIPFFEKALEAAATGIHPFLIKFTSFGSFRQGKQDLIYVKIKNYDNALEKITNSLQQTGRGDMKSFVPHVTMIRKANTNYTSLKFLKKKRFDLPLFKVDTLHLMESKKIDKKLIYRSIYSVKLKEKNT